jgi:MFS family permease
LEIPTGAVGDYFGKKVSISIGAFLFFLGLSIYSLGTSFTIFLIAEVIAGFGSSLISGSDSAFIHGTLKGLGKERMYKRIEGNANALLLTGFLVAGLIGGYVGDFSLRGTMVLTAGSAFLVFSISLFFKEPKRIAINREKYSVLISDSLRIIKGNKGLVWLFFYSSLLTAIAYIISWFYQPFFILVKVDVFYYGWIYALLGIVAIISSKYAHAIERFFGRTGSLIFLGILVCVLPLLIGNYQTIFAISLFALHQIYMGISKVIYNDRILTVVPSSRSATIISINNMGNRFFFALLGPFFGYLTDTYTLKFTLISLGIFSLSILVLLFLVRLFLNFSTDISQSA